MSSHNDHELPVGLWVGLSYTLQTGERDLPAFSILYILMPMRRCMLFTLHHKENDNDQTNFVHSRHPACS